MGADDQKNMFLRQATGFCISSGGLELHESGLHLGTNNPNVARCHTDKPKLQFGDHTDTTLANQTGKYLNAP